MRLHLETPRVEIQGLEKKTMVTSLKHPGKKQSGSSSRLPLTWTKRATPPALAHSATSTGPWDRQMDRMTDIERLKTLRQTDAQTRCRNLQGPARPGDRCAGPRNSRPPRVLGPTNLCLEPLQTTSPRHPAIPPSCYPSAQCARRDAPTRRARHPEPGCRRGGPEGPRPHCERRRRPRPGYGSGPADTHRAPRIPPPPPAPALPSLGGLQVSAARSAGRTAEHAQSRPEGRGPGRP